MVQTIIHVWWLLSNFLYIFWITIIQKNKKIAVKKSRRVHKNIPWSKTYIITNIIFAQTSLYKAYILIAHIFKIPRFHTDHTDNPCEVLKVDPQGYALVITRNDGLIGEVTNSMWANPGIVNIDTPYRLNHHIHYPVAGDISPRGNEILILTKHQIYILLECPSSV